MHPRSSAILSIALLALAIFTSGCKNLGKKKARAAGSLVFSGVPAGQDADAFLKTEAEVLRSRGNVERSLEALGDGADRDSLEDRAAATRDHVEVSRRAGTWILDVRVELPSPKDAIAVCDALLQQYLEAHIGAKLEVIQGKMASAGARLEQLDGGPGAAAARSELEALERQRTAATEERDVNVLERCALAK